MIKLVVSGFQTGVDQAGIRAAHRAGIPISGFLPLGWLTEDGPRPEFERLYGAIQHSSPLYPPRTEANVKLAKVTIWFGPGDSAGYHCTRNACNRNFKAFREVTGNLIDHPEDTARQIVLLDIESINIAGSRESKRPGIGAVAEAFFDEVFRIVLSRSKE